MANNLHFDLILHLTSREHSLRDITFIARSFNFFSYHQNAENKAIFDDCIKLEKKRDILYPKCNNNLLYIDNSRVQVETLSSNE